MNMLISRLDLTETKTIAWWSDPAPHFRCHKVFGTQATLIMEATKCNQKVFYGCEAHFKNPCDALFGRMNHDLDLASTKELVVDTADLCGIWQQAQREHVQAREEVGGN